MRIPAEDQDFVAQFAPQSPPDSLLTFAKQNHLQVTDGFEPGHGHNAGSKHYQGDPQHPGAIDVNNRGVDLSNLQRLAAQDGYVVRDERSHPAGQQVWIGPHYHIEKAGSAKAKPQAVHPDDQAFVSQFAPQGQPAAPNMFPSGKLSPAMMGQQAGVPASTLNYQPAIAPSASLNQGYNGPDMSGMQQANQAILGHTLQQFQPPPAAPVTPPTGVQGLLNAGLEYGKGVVHQISQIPQALGDEYNQFTTDPSAGIKAYGAAGTGLLQGTRDLLQMPADLGAGLRSAWEGKPYDPVYKLPNVSDIPLVGQPLAQNMQAHPVFGTVGNLVGQSLLPEAAHLMGAKPPVAPDLAEPTLSSRLQQPIQTEADLVRRAAVPDQRAQLAQTVGDLKQGQQPKGTADTLRHLDNQQQMSLYDSPARMNPAQATANPGDLAKAFAERQRPTEAPQIINPETERATAAPAAAADILGQSKIENAGPLDLATRDGVKETPQIQIDRGLPEGEPITPAPERSKLLNEFGNEAPDLGQRKVMSGRDAALLRAEEISKRDTPDLSTIPDRGAAESRSPSAVPDLSNPANERPQLVQPHATPDLGKVLEFPGKREPSSAEILGPSGKPLTAPTPEAAPAEPAGRVGMGLDSAPQTPSAGSSFPAGGVLDPTAAPQAVKDAVAKSGGQLVSIAQAEQFVKQHQPEQMPHLLNAVKAAQQEQSWSRTHQPIEQGRQLTTTREASPVAVELRTISPKREVEVLKHDHSPAGDRTNPDYAAIRDNLVQRLQKNGIRVNAQDQAVEGLKPAKATEKLNKLAAQLPGHERTHAYIYDHNPGETARGMTEGYGAVRLDRVTDSSLTGNKATIPEGTAHTNQIAPAFKAFRDMVNAPDAPASLKRVSKQLDSGNISRQSYKELQNAYKDLTPEKLAELCKRF